MKIVVVTCDYSRSLRPGFLDVTLASLRWQARDVEVYDNGGYHAGIGIASGLRRLLLHKGPVIMSQDDVYWKPGSVQAVADFWSAAPDDIAIMCPVLQAEYGWNETYKVEDIGGQRALIRASVPAQAWTMRAAANVLGRVKSEPVGTDYHTCLALCEAGWRLAEIDAAIHLGVGSSLVYPGFLPSGQRLEEVVRL